MPIIGASFRSLRITIRTDGALPPNLTVFCVSPVHLKRRHNSNIRNSVQSSRSARDDEALDVRDNVHRKQSTPGPFTPSEDLTLTSLRSQRLSWPAIRLALPNRSVNGLWLRWTKHLRPKLPPGTMVEEPSEGRLLNGRFVQDFTPEEDEKLLALREQSVPYRVIVNEHFPDRSLRSLKTHMHNLRIRQSTGTDVPRE